MVGGERFREVGFQSRAGDLGANYTQTATEIKMSVLCVVPFKNHFWITQKKNKNLTESPFEKHFANQVCEFVEPF